MMLFLLQLEVEDFFVVVVEGQGVFGDEDVVGFFKNREETLFGIHIGFGAAD